MKNILGDRDYKMKTIDLLKDKCNINNTKNKIYSLETKIIAIIKSLTIMRSKYWILYYGMKSCDL